MRFWKWEFCQEMWIQKCEFCGKWMSENVNFVKIGNLEMWILPKMRIPPMKRHLAFENEDQIKKSWTLPIPSSRILSILRCSAFRFLYSLIFSLMGSSKCLYRFQTVDNKVAKIWDTSAMTESVKGIPTIANRIQKTRPAVVTGAILPYPGKMRPF